MMRLHTESRAAMQMKVVSFLAWACKKLSLACGGDNYIETVWGRGYVLREVEGDVLTPQAAVA